MKVAQLLIPLCLSVSAVAAQPDAVSLVKNSIANYEHDWREAEQWRWRVTETTWSGGVKKVQVSESMPILGTPYEKVISKDGRPVPAEEEEREQEKYQKTVQRREKESPAQRAARIRNHEQEWAFLNEIPNAYDLSIAGKQTINERPAWIVNLTRRPDFSPKSFRASMLKHIEGKLWIDEKEVRWVKAEAHVLDAIGIGWILARVEPGAHINLSFTRVAENLWLPESINISGAAKVMMFYRKNLDEEIRYSDYSRVGKDVPQHVTGISRERGQAPNR